MSVLEINWQPTQRQLRQFGATCIIALPLLCRLWGGSWWLTGAFALAGIALAALGAVVPGALKPVFLLLTIVALPIGLVVGELAMILVFFGVFLPLGLLFRWRKRDALDLKIDRAQQSYWRPKEQPSDPARYFRQS